MTDQATTPVSHVQSTAAPNQNASYPVLETRSEAETPKNGQNHENGQSEPANGRKKGLAPAFTPQTAREMQARAVAARLEQKRLREQALIQKAATSPANPELELVEEQICHTRAVLNDKDYRYCEACRRSGMEPHHRAALLRALDSLLDRKRILMGIPGPGTLKPMSQSRRRAAPSDLAPLPISPADGQ